MTADTADPLANIDNEDAHGFASYTRNGTVSDH